MQTFQSNKGNKYTLANVRMYATIIREIVCRRGFYCNGGSDICGVVVLLHFVRDLINKRRDRFNQYQLTSNNIVRHSICSLLNTAYFNIQ